MPTRKLYLEIDELLAAAYTHGADRTLSYDQDKERVRAIKLASSNFVKKLEAQRGSPVAWRTFVRATNSWSYTEQQPPPRTELSPHWTPLYDVAELLAMLKIGMALGSVQTATKNGK